MQEVHWLFHSARRLAAVNIVFKNPSDECIYDVQAVYGDGSAWEATGLDLCTISVVTVNDKDITWQ